MWEGGHPSVVIPARGLFTLQLERAFPPALPAQRKKVGLFTGSVPVPVSCALVQGVSLAEIQKQCGRSGQN